MKGSDLCLVVVLGAVAVFAFSPWSNSTSNAAFLEKIQTRSLAAVAEQREDSKQLQRAGGSASSLQAGTGHSTDFVGDIQQSQDGAGQADRANIGSALAEVTFRSTGDIRSVTVQGSRMVLSCEGVCTITVPTGL